MHLKIVPFSCFPFLFFFFIIMMIDIPFSSCAKDRRHMDCNKTYECGNMSGIGFPFWGNGRANYCGQTGLELQCRNNYTEMEIMSQKYRILSIDQKDQTLRIARIDLWDNICPAQFVNTTLNFSLFDYAPGNVNMNVSFYYGCPRNMSTGKINGIARRSNAESKLPASLPRNQTPDISGCNVSIIVPVLGKAVSGFAGNASAFVGVLREGFDVKYFCPDGAQRRNCSNLPTPKGGAHKLSLGVKIGTGVGTGLVAFVIIAAVVIFNYSRRKPPPSANNTIIVQTRKKTSGQNVEAFLKNHGPLAQKRYNYSDVKKMTNSFRDKLGQGGYGGVFKGKLADGRIVAVKVLSETKGNGEEFINEVASISRTSHVNIVSLLGFCVEGRKRALIYEFMPNGSLEKFIYDENSEKKLPQLGWETLYKIAIGIARGLEYLHRGCNTRILHFDIKPHNILLDEDFCPKIADFGLAKLCLVKESIISMTGARGTPGYIAPELVSRNFGGVSHKSDVYSYGMMVLEMVGRRKNFDLGIGNTSEIYFPLWIHRHLDLCEDLELHGVTTMEEKEFMRKMILVGLWCIQIDPSTRPPMSRVLEMLEGNLEAIQIPPKPFLNSPSRE